MVWSEQIFRLIEEAEEEDIQRSYCMCGLEVTHSSWEGHEPVSQWCYYRLMGEVNDLL